MRPGAAEALGQPAVLLVQARAAQEAGEPALAYSYASLIRTLHPDSPEGVEAFSLAANSYRQLYARSRYDDPSSIWLTSEPIFMFEWLATFFGEVSPADQTRSLLIGMPAPFVARFESYGDGHPRLGAWTIRCEIDNGKVVSVSAARSPSIPAATAE